jgi:hypothetical protein
VWIPRAVWESRALTLQEKAMLVEIDSLDNSRGCFASNRYFAEFFSLSAERVRRVIASLSRKKLIRLKLDPRGKNDTRRTIRVVNKLGTIRANLPGGMVGNDHTGMVGNDHHSNTAISNTVRNSNREFKNKELGEKKAKLVKGMSM